MACRLDFSEKGEGVETVQVVSMIICCESRTQRDRIGQIDKVSNNLGTALFAARLNLEQRSRSKTILAWVVVRWKGDLVERKRDLR